MDAGGDSEQITHSPTSIEQISWRPDGKPLAFVAEDDEPERKGRAKFDDAIEIGNNDFLTRTRQMPAHIWLQELPAGPDAKAPDAKRLTSGSWSLPLSMPPGPPASPLQWSPDGKRLYFVKVPTPLSGDGAESTVQVLDVATGQYKPLTGPARLESVPVVSPDGTQVAYLQNRDANLLHATDVFLTGAASGSGRDLTVKLDKNILRAEWMPDGKSLLVGSDVDTTLGLWLQPTDGGPARRLQTGDVTPMAAFWLDASISGKGVIAFTGSTPKDPGEVFLMDAAHGAPVQLTNLNAEIASREIARQETMTWPSMKDGPPSDGVVTYPIGYTPGKKYPLVVFIHGGPAMSSVQTWTTSSQRFAAQGWMVFEPNYRGSDNLGNAYRAALWNDTGKGPGDDVMAGLAALLKKGEVDEKNIAVSGWSYGGFMTSWLLGHSTIWKASVDGAAVNSWLDMYDLCDGNVTVKEYFAGSPYASPANMKAFVDQSPITYVSNVRTPTLVMSDVGDYRVPITQSYAWYRGLRDNGVTTQFIAFPVGGHSPHDPLRREDMMRRWVQWLGRYLPSDPGSEAYGLKTATNLASKQDK